MNRIFVCLIVVFTSIYTTITFAQSDLWQIANTASKVNNADAAIQYFGIDDQALRSKLNLVPNELRGQTDTIQLPMPDGTLARFTIVESSIMEDGLAAKFPDIKSYKVYGIDDPSASGRVDLSPKGFRGMLMTSQGRVFIDPDQSTSNRYVSRLRNGRHAHADPEQPFQCSVYDLPNNRTVPQNFSSNKTVSRIPGSLTTYRIAVSATPEYVTAVGGTLNTAMAEINTAINRVNQIYERDLGIRLFLVTNNDRIVDVAPADAGFTNNSGVALLSQNQAWIDAQIGSANYDIGHVFSTGGGGVARLQSVCSTSNKAKGVTGLPNPTGEPFYIDFVAHEIGHQFGGNHTYNGTVGSCGGQRNPSTAFEPGSGTTIMGYAGICGTENIETASDATFHAGSINEINTFVTTLGGASCDTPLVITPVNTDPTGVNAGINRVIPKSTPFQLIGTGVDTGDTLSYQWDQMDTGASTDALTLGTDLATNTLFRSYVPQPTGVRDFPVLSSQIANINGKGETLPTTARTLNFRLIVRDGKSGMTTSDVLLTVDGNSGPFTITSQNTASTFPATSNPTVTWNVANTNVGPISCSSVDIDLLTFSTDSSTYGITPLIAGTPNDGTEAVIIPDRSGSKARFRVSCSSNIFYDISDADSNITGTLMFPTTGNSANVTGSPAAETITVIGGPPAPVPNTGIPSGIGGGGGGLVDDLMSYIFLCLLLGRCWLLRARKLMVTRADLL